MSKTYVKQITFVIKSFQDMNCPDKINSKLHAITGSGAKSTKHAYLTTLQNFLNFLELNFPYVHPKTVQSLLKHVDYWLKGQQQQKEKDTNFINRKFKENSMAFHSPNAILVYEKQHKKELGNLQQKNCCKETTSKLCIHTFS